MTQHISTDFELHKAVTVFQCPLSRWHLGQKLVQELKTDGAKKEINLQSQDIGDAQVQVCLERRFILRRHVVDLPGARRSVEDEREHHPHQP